jgi:hypothetical protein
VRRAVVVSLLVLTVVMAATPVVARPVPASAAFRGRSITWWQRDYMAWATGAAESSVMTGSCGEMGARGVFYLAPAATPGTTVLACDIPVGTPVLALVAVSFSEIPTWGATDEAIEADALATYGNFQDISATLDGRAISLDGRFREAGAYDVAVEEGSLWDVICDGLPAPCQVDFAPPGPVRMASVGQMVILTPMSPGAHVFEVSASQGDVALNLEAHLHVG